LYRFDAYLPDEAKSETLQRVSELKAQYEIGARRPRLIEPPPPVEQLSLLALVS
jgi:hypothetical protein